MRLPLELDNEAKLEADNEIVDADLNRRDKYGLDIDSEFRQTKNKRFTNWEETFKSSNEVRTQIT